jgi:TetR/AcrR family transcriptional regulator, cholesterol catabolism regulator
VLLETKETQGVSAVVEQTENSNVKCRIIDYAVELFKQSGFSKVTVEDITSGLGMSKKTFYKCFESKEDLLFQMVKRITGEIGLRLETIQQSDQPFVQKLHALITLVHSQFRKFSTPLLRDIQIYAPGTWDYIQEFRRNKILTIWSGLIEQGKREGFIRADINSRLLLLSIIGLIEAVVNPTTLSNESFSTDEAMRGIMGMIFRGILTDAAVRQLDSLQLPQLS